MWILLDNQSTCNVFSNPRLLQNIRSNDKTLTIFSTGGKSFTDKIGDLPGFGTVWFHEKGIANILSLALVKRKYRVTYDSQNGNTFDVYINDQDVRKFYESDTGLYYSDMRYHTDRDANVLVNTVSENKTKYDH